jgi:hypothetical protein
MLSSKPFRALNNTINAKAPMANPAMDIAVIIFIAEGFFLEKKYLRAINAETFTRYLMEFRSTFGLLN